MTTRVLPNLVPGPVKLPAGPEEVGWSPGSPKVTGPGHLAVSCLAPGGRHLALAQLRA